MTSTTRLGMSDVSAVVHNVVSLSPKVATPLWRREVTAAVYMPKPLITPRPRVAEKDPRYAAVRARDEKLARSPIVFLVS